MNTRAGQYLESFTNEVMRHYPNAENQLRAITEELETLPAVVADVATMRRVLLHEMRENGFTVQQLADAMGKSRARVYELLR